MAYAGEPRRDAAIAGLERCRKLAARDRRSDPRLARSWLPAPTSGRDTPRAADDPTLAVELERTRRELASASARVEAANAAAAHADDTAETARVTLLHLDDAQRQREEAWRRRMYESVRPMWIVGGLATAGSAMSVLASMLLLEARGEITSGERQFGSQAERDAALRLNTGGQIACYAVAVPLLAAGVILLVAGKRRWTASGIGLSTAVGGLTLRF